ncbi:MAG: hypothetical protein AAF288_09580 [Planctomycetota bacterium]
MSQRPPRWSSLGAAGVVYADVSGYSQLVYQSIDTPERLDRLALGMSRLLAHDQDRWPGVAIEGYAGDGFVAVCDHPKPARLAHRFAQDLHARFADQVRPLLMDLGFRVDVRLRVAFDVGKVVRVELDGAPPGSSTPGAHPPAAAPPDIASPDTNHTPAARSVLMSECAIVAARIASGQCCRRFGTAMSRRAYKRLMLAGGKAVRDPDEVIQDRNRFPEPIDVYRLHPDETASIDAPRPDSPGVD